MRETRLSGSEGGARLIPRSYPYHDYSRNRGHCRPGALTGRFFNRLLGTSG